MSGLAPDLATLLREHGLEGVPEEPLRGGGYTGAGLVRLRGHNESYVLKRIGPMQHDWMRRALDDTQCREIAFALSPIVARLPEGVAVASIGAAADGPGRALLMRDLTSDLVPERMMSAALLDAILRGVADLHATFWDEPLDALDEHPISVETRLTLLGPVSAARLKADGVDFGFVEGWRAFERSAPAAARDLARRLFRDPVQLARMIYALPLTLIHGDLKVANMAYGDGTLTLLDWALVMRSATAIDIAWFLAVNSSLLPETLDHVLARYAAHLERALGPAAFAASRWAEQRDVVMLVGLMLYGWGKALDAEAGRPDELHWWCDGAAEAARSLDL